MYHDHHFHPLGYVSLVNGLELMNAETLDQVMSMLTAHADRVEGPVIAQRLNDEGVKDGRLPVAAEIDDVTGHRPALLYRYCGHIAVANSAALRLAGIDSDTVDPPGGSFDRDQAGNPNGILRETAIQLVSQPLAPLIPPPSDSEILSALGRLPAMGLGSVTGIISAGGSIWCGVEDEIETLCRLAPDLPIDMDILVIADRPEQLIDAKQKIDGAGGRIRFHGYKDFTDGSLGGHTAAMYEPFADVETTGTVRIDHNKALLLGQTSLDLGGVVAIHAIGDRANDLALDVLEQLIADGADPRLLRIEHASILTDASIERMARLGVVASVQPAFLASEETWLVKRLGTKRMQRAYPFRSMAEAGIPLLGGSDTPVELPDPETGINAAVVRHGINSSQALSRGQAEAMFSPPVG